MFTIKRTLCIIYINFIQITSDDVGVDPRFAFIAGFIDSQFALLISKFLLKLKLN